MKFEVVDNGGELCGDEEREKRKGWRRENWVRRRLAEMSLDAAITGLIEFKVWNEHLWKYS